MVRYFSCEVKMTRVVFFALPGVSTGFHLKSDRGRLESYEYQWFLRNELGRGNEKARDINVCNCRQNLINSFCDSRKKIPKRMYTLLVYTYDTHKNVYTLVCVHNCISAQILLRYSYLDR